MRPSWTVSGFLAFFDVDANVEGGRSPKRGASCVKSGECFDRINIAVTSGSDFVSAQIHSLRNCRQTPNLGCTYISRPSERSTQQHIPHVHSPAIVRTTLHALSHISSVYVTRVEHLSIGGFGWGLERGREREKRRNLSCAHVRAKG